MHKRNTSTPSEPDVTTPTGLVNENFPHNCPGVVGKFCLTHIYIVFSSLMFLFSCLKKKINRKLKTDQSSCVHAATERMKVRYLRINCIQTYCYKETQSTVSKHGNISSLKQGSANFQWGFYLWDLCVYSAFHCFMVLRMGKETREAQTLFLYLVLSQSYDLSQPTYKTQA